MADKYANIPEKYRHLCHEDDVELGKKSWAAYVFTLLKYFFLYQCSEEKSATVFIRNYHSNHFRSRITHYRAIASDYKLNIEPSVHTVFEAEYDKIINAMDSGNPSTWLHFFLFIEWCQKFADTHSRKIDSPAQEKSTLSLPDVNDLFDELSKR